MNLVEVYSSNFFIKDIEMPERRRLRVIPKTPFPKPPLHRNIKMEKDLDLMRGDEEVATDYLYGQYGIVVSILID